MSSLHNILSSINYNDLKKQNKKLKNSYKKISSGKRINKAADDAAGMAISEKMKTKIRGTKQALKNIDDGISLLETANGGLKNMLSYTQKMRELAVEAANGTLTEKDRKKLNKEFQELKQGINNIIDNTEFASSKMKLLKPPVIKNQSPDNSKSGKVDIVFAVDNTGSMNVIQEEVKNKLTKFIDSIKKSGVNDIRMGLVEYRDDVINEFTFSSNQWTDNTQNIENGLQNLINNNSGSTENLMTTIDYITNNYNFRKNTDKTQVKNIVFVTNEDSDDKSELTNTKSSIQNNDIITHGIYNYTENNTAIEDLINSTNGESIDINDSSWGNKLINNLGKSIGESGSVEDKDMPVLKIQTGPDQGQNLKLELEDMRKLNLNFLEIKNQDQANKTISKLDNIINKITEVSSKYGAYQNRLIHSKKNMSNYKTNISKANSMIVDTNMAKEVTKITKRKILQNAGQAMIAHTKNVSQNLLDLLA